MRQTVSLNKNRRVVLFDGSRPLCSTEIDLYKDNVMSNKLCFIDIFDQNTVLSSLIDRKVAMFYFHVVSQDGQILSGISGFIEVWQHFRCWRWLAKIALLPGMP